MSTTWPSDWPERLSSKDCPMCAQGRLDEDEYGIRIHAGRYSDAYLRRATWQPGYTVVTWRGRHVAEPTELDEGEASGLLFTADVLAGGWRRQVLGRAQARG